MLKYFYHFILTTILIALTSSQSEARIFSLKEVHSGSYFQGALGYPNLQKEAYISSGSQTEFNKKPQFNRSGEVGFFFPTTDFALKLGFQIQNPDNMSNLKGTDSSQNDLMNLDSRIYGFFPMLHLEFYPKILRYGRIFWSIGGGYGKIKVTNSYDLTPTGSALYSLSNFKEHLSQYTYTAETSLGYEILISQTTSVAINTGYRYLLANDLKYDNAVTNFTGSHQEGDSVLNANGHKKKIDLSGAFVGLVFKVYFNF